MLKKILIIVIISITGFYIYAEDYIHSYLLLGPFLETGLEKECFKNEAKIIPEKGKITEGKKWKKYDLSDNILNFEDPGAFGENDNCMGLAYVKIKSPKNMRAHLLIGSDDGIRVYLNKDEILLNDIPRGVGFDQDKINIVLKKGWNHLLMKVEDLGGGWALVARITDLEGNDIKELQYYPKPVERIKIIATEASSQQYDAGQKQTWYSTFVIDKNMKTRWGSDHKDPQWLLLTLNKKAKIKRIVIHWETACAKEYNIQFSNDKKKWKTVYENNMFNGGTDDIKIKSEEAKYIKINGVKRKTEWGYSIFEVEVFD